MGRLCASVQRILEAISPDQKIRSNFLEGRKGGSRQPEFGDQTTKTVTVKVTKSVVLTAPRLSLVVADQPFNRHYDRS